MWHEEYEAVLYRQGVDSEGGVVGKSVAVATDLGEETFPAISGSNDKGSYLVAWSQETDNDIDIYFTLGIAPLSRQEFGYDPAGNRTVMTETTPASGAVVTNYSYDAANRLIKVEQGGVTYTMRYNGVGDRVEQAVNGEMTTYTLECEAYLRAA